MQKKGITNTNQKFNIKKSSKLRTKMIQQKVMKDLEKFKTPSQGMLPILRESLSNPLLKSVKASPYENRERRIDLNLSASNLKSKLKNNHVRFNYSVESPYTGGSEARIKRSLRNSRDPYTNL